MPLLVCKTVALGVITAFATDNQISITIPYGIVFSVKVVGSAHLTVVVRVWFPAYERFAIMAPFNVSKFQKLFV